MTSSLSRCLAAVFILACSPGLPDMRRCDALVTSAETQCKQAPAAQKLSTCRRAQSCIEPAKKAQHSIQDMLVRMAKMEDSADDRLAASAAEAGAVAACGVAGFVAVRTPASAAPTAQPNTANVIVDHVTATPTTPATNVPPAKP